MKNQRSTIINLLAALVSIGVQMFIGFWLSPYVVNNLGEEAYGFLNLANNFISYASLAAVAINSMACRFISIEYNQGHTEESRKYFCSVFMANCILYGLIMLLASIFIGNMEKVLHINPQLVMQVKLTFFLSFANMGISMIGTVYTSAAFVTNLMHYNSLIQIASNIVRSILIFALFGAFPPKIYYLSIATLISGIFAFVGNYFLTKKLLKGFDIQLKYYDFKKLIKITKSGVWMLLSNISNLLLNGLDLLLGNWFINGVVMGRISLAKQIPLALGNALGGFSNIFSSSLTKVFAEDGPERLLAESTFQLRVLGIFFSVPYAGIIVFGQEFLALWLRNANYANDQRIQIYILMLLTLLDIVTSTYIYIVHSIFIALDKVKKYASIVFAASCISIIVTLLLLDMTSLGAYAIAGTSTIILGVTNGFIIPAYAAKLMGRKLSFFWKTESKSWVLLGILCIAFYFMKLPMTFTGWGNFLGNMAICAVVGYVISVIFIFSKKEIAFILQRLKRKSKKIYQ